MTPRPRQCTPHMGNAGLRVPPPKFSGTKFPASLPRPGGIRGHPVRPAETRPDGLMPRRSVARRCALQRDEGGWPGKLDHTSQVPNGVANARRL